VFCRAIPGKEGRGGFVVDGKEKKKANGFSDRKEERSLRKKSCPGKYFRNPNLPLGGFMQGGKKGGGQGLLA